MNPFWIQIFEHLLTILNARLEIVIQYLCWAASRYSDAVVGFVPPQPP